METISTLILSFELRFGLNELLFFGTFIFFSLTILLTLKLGKTYLFVLIAILSVMMNIFVVKPYQIFGIATYGGNEIYGVICLATDVLAEHYGKKEALKAVPMGFLALFIYFFFSVVFVFMEPNLAAYNASEIQSAFEIVFTPVLGIVIASMAAFFVSNTFDVYVYDFIHRLTGEKMLWLRSNLSTFTSQFLDTTIFSFIAAFFGIFTWDIIWEVIIFAYVFKILISLLNTPFMYLSLLVVKKK